MALEADRSTDTADEGLDLPNKMLLDWCYSIQHGVLYSFRNPSNHVSDAVLGKRVRNSTLRRGIQVYVGQQAQSLLPQIILHERAEWERRGFQIGDQATKAELLI